MGQVQTSGFQPLCAPAQKSGHSSDRAMQRSLRDSVAEALGVTAKGHGVHGLAIDIRDELATAADGKNAVTSVMATIDRALDDAAKKLSAQGLSQDDIDAGIARFKSRLAREIGELSGNATTAPADAAARQKSAIAAREEVRERFSLDVLTTEGDHVTIRFASQRVTDAAAATVSNDGGSVTRIEGNVISRGRFQVAVDGDLNDAERTAIAGLLDQVDDIAADFFGGDVQAAFAAAARVGLESEALSAFDLRLSYSRSLAAVKAYASNAQLGSEMPAQPAPVATKPAAEPKPQAGPKLVSTPADTASTDPVAVPAQTETSSTPPVDLATVQQGSNDLVTAPAIEGKPVSAAVAHTAAKASSALETITQFAKDVLDRLDEKDESKATRFSLRWKVEFMIKAFGSVALNAVEQKAAEALGIALDAQNPGA
jgi:hypothetical protein